MTQGQSPLVQNQPYILGHADRELDRLVKQAQFFGDLTAHVLTLAGLKPGMRVLDIGCGAGDVSFLAAKFVGPEGTVIGVDKSPEATALASKRATDAGLTHVQFLTSDVLEVNLEEPVDALIGRFVLVYLSDPVALLRHLVRFVKPDGIVAFHEMSMDGARSEPAVELFERTLARLKLAHIRAGIDIRSSLKLSRTFRKAGLPTPEMIQAARVESGPDALIYEQAAQVTRSLLPLIERTGVATAEEIDIETLAARLRHEALALDATLVSPSLIGAWTRKPND